MYDHNDPAGYYRANDVSPLALPRSLHHQQQQQHSQFGNLAQRMAPNPTSIPIFQGHSPRLSPPASDLDKRTRSLSPGRNSSQPWLASPSISAVSNVSLATSPDNNLDAAAVAHQLRRVTLQNRRLLENWEAERTHLEANRARAEEVYREEREIMDDERDMWMQHKTSLELKLIELEQRAHLAETERDTLARQLDFMGKQAQALPNSQNTSDNPTRLPMSKARSASPSPPTSTSAPHRFLTPKDGISPLTGVPFAGSGVTMPASQPFVPLDPRMQGPSPRSGSPNECPAQVPSIDVSEVVPQLEGIRLKQPTIEKPTFAVVEPSSASSPAGQTRSPANGSASGSPGSKSRTSPVERAIEVLHAPESSRLTMHAGHTPSHSMSFSKLPTLMSTASANTAGSSGAVTPDEKEAEVAPVTSDALQIAPSHGEDGQVVSEDPQAIYEPSEGDRPLIGQTHLMNRPAVDEPFLQLLAEKLQSADPIPTVVRNSLSSEEAEAATTQPAVNADASKDGATETPEQIEEDIPLKLKGGSNFGLPFGSMGRH